MRQHQNKKRTVAGMAAVLLLCLAQPVMGQLVGRMERKIGASSNSFEKGVGRQLITQGNYYDPCYQWKLRAEVDVPAFKFTREEFVNGTGDTLYYFAGRPFVGIGGGLKFDYVYWHESRKENGPDSLSPTTLFSFSPLTIYLHQRDASDLSPANIDFSIAGTVGIYNNLFQIGFGRDFGIIEANRTSRWFLSCSIGVTFNK